jgi:hypothetical protein
MELTKTQRLILFSLGQFYRQLNQPLQEKPLKLRTSKIVFITFLRHSKIITAKARALYKNLETLEDKKLIEYDQKMIKFTKLGLEILAKINQEIQQFIEIKEFFKKVEKPKRKLQTTIQS